jgi:hypothetical protein
MWEESGRWRGRLDRTGERVEVEGRIREECLAELRREAGDDASLTIEEVPALAGVAEAAAIMGWDKRRVITYLNRRSFPEPVAALASGRVWLRRDVEVFAAGWHARQASRARARPHAPPSRGAG